MSATAKPPCKYGSKCYRRNPYHLAEFSHPGKHSQTKGNYNCLQYIVEDNDEEVVVKKQKLEVPADQEVIVIEDEKKDDAIVVSKPSGKPREPAGSSLQSPMFYLTTVRGLNSQYNGAAMSVGINGTTKHLQDIRD